MKRILSVILLVVVLCLGFTVNAYAASDDITISEDYQTIQMDGTVYTRTNTNTLTFYDTYYFETDLNLTPKQQQELGTCQFSIDETNSFLVVEFYYRDGSCLTAGYVSEDLKNTMEQVSTDNDLELMVDFEWPYENFVTTTVNDLMGTPTVLSGDTLYWSEQIPVCLCLEQDIRYIHRGYVLVESGRFYYVDIRENGLDYLPYWTPSEADSVNAYIVTDPAVLAQLEEALDSRNSVNDIFTDDIFTTSLSAVVITMAFGLFPAAILVLALILSIRSKGYYRLIWAITAGFAAAVLLTYVGFVILISVI